MRVECQYITFKDLQAMGYCHRGVRAWCLRNGLDWAKIVSERRFPVDRLRSVDDAMAKRLVQWVDENGK